MFTIGGSIHNRQKLETTPVSSHRQVDRQTWSVHPVDYLLSHKMEGSADTGYNVDDP